MTDQLKQSKRYLLKLSGEALCVDGSFGIDYDTVEQMAKTIAEAASTGSQIAIVIGGGNFMRGSRCPD